VQFQSILVELNPDFAQGWFARALTRVQTGDLQGARKDLQQTLVLEPNHYRAMAQLAFILHQAGEDKAALESIRKLKAVHPHFFNDPGAAEQGLKELEQKVEGRGI
jgi:tetratricopeptide (TPR) repeat protein